MFQKPVINCHAPFENFPVGSIKFLSFLFKVAVGVYLQRALVMLASLTFRSVVRLLMSTVIICTGMCCTKLARAIDGSNEGSVNKEAWLEINTTPPIAIFI